MRLLEIYRKLRGRKKKRKNIWRQYVTDIKSELMPIYQIIKIKKRKIAQNLREIVEHFFAHIS